MTLNLDGTAKGYGEDAFPVQPTECGFCEDGYSDGKLCDYCHGTGQVITDHDSYYE